MAMGDPLPNLPGLTEFDNLDTTDLLARLIYAEASTQSKTGKAGVAWVVSNRVDKNLSEFGGNTYKGVILKTNAFEGMTSSNARQPNTSSTAWSDSVEQALASSRLSNPIGTCLWFVTNTYFASKVIKSGTTEYWNFGAGNNKIVEKKVLGDHTFYRVEGY
ncbi:cell wall hydrolase [Paenibacillus sp. OK003]|uniref:cell wall hydrolase n=1 Tax=Paenibacillus sp. OK003 TaxID=1884380 RepID=UPI0008AF4D2E|nr:cell wall hydrolase [Paenibacillus sp. OK003]SEK43245.1 Cell Wall Hydrolase [Paenibacillus sp. OK003]